MFRRRSITSGNTGKRQVRKQFSAMGIMTAFVGNLYGRTEEEGGTERIIHKFPTLWACNRSLIPLRLISRSFPFPQFLPVLRRTLFLTYTDNWFSWMRTVLAVEPKLCVKYVKDLHSLRNELHGSANSGTFRYSSISGTSAL
jgi:hypothetical protein